MTMLQMSRADVVQAPFPHVVKQGVLPADLFERLRADFPRDDVFEDEHARSGSAASRAGPGTGFDIYRGDDSYDRLLETSAAWREFDAYINSRDFVDDFMAVFGPDLAAQGIGVPIEAAHYDRAFVEPRSTLRDKVTLGQRVRGIVEKVLPQSGPPKLFTRLDIERSTKGYLKPPHCDRGNRLCSLIVYFTDMEELGVKGGDLSLFAHNDDKTPEEHERHPRPDNVHAVATVRPRANLGVFFPCSNDSYHGVSAVETPGVARDFLYINISTDNFSCWK